MPKRLTGSPGTGKKIMQNPTLFHYTYNGSEPLSEGKMLYKFNWSFDNYQSGIISIVLRSDRTITNDSLIICNKNQREFASTLGAYKDDSLYSLFGWMLQKQNIDYKLF